MRAGLQARANEGGRACLRQSQALRSKGGDSSSSNPRQPVAVHGRQQFATEWITRKDGGFETWRPSLDGAAHGQPFDDNESFDSARHGVKQAACRRIDPDLRHQCCPAVCALPKCVGDGLSNLSRI